MVTLAERFRAWRRRQRVKAGRCRQCGRARRTESALCGRCLADKAQRMRRYRLSAEHPKGA